MSINRKQYYHITTFSCKRDNCMDKRYIILPDKKRIWINFLRIILCLLHEITVIVMHNLLCSFTIYITIYTNVIKMLIMIITIIIILMLCTILLFWYIVLVYTVTMTIFCWFYWLRSVELDQFIWLIYIFIKILCICFDLCSIGQIILTNINNI